MWSMGVFNGVRYIKGYSMATLCNVTIFTWQVLPSRYEVLKLHIVLDSSMRWSNQLPSLPDTCQKIFQLPFCDIDYITHQSPVSTRIYGQNHIYINAWDRFLYLHSHNVWIQYSNSWGTQCLISDMMRIHVPRKTKFHENPAIYPMMRWK